MSEVRPGCAAVPRYFFHRTDGDFERDDEGVELDGMENARRHAVIYAGETLKDTPDIVFGKEMNIEVTDENMLILFTVFIATLETPAQVSNAK